MDGNLQEDRQKVATICSLLYPLTDEQNEPLKQ
jgi:hypothetical protein